MLGLVVIAFIAAYFAISGLVIWLAASWAKKHNRRTWAWGGLAAFVMYNLVFWDWIPTVATHQYYCAKDSGFWVYKTLDQWKAENPGVMETLVANKSAPSTRQGDTQNFTDTDFLNQRINNVLKKSGPHLFNRWRWEQDLVDSKTNEVLVRSVDFSTGNGNIGGDLPPRFWLQSGGCTGDSAVNDSRFHALRRQFMGRQE